MCLYRHISTMHSIYTEDYITKQSFNNTVISLVAEHVPIFVFWSSFSFMYQRTICVVMPTYVFNSGYMCKN